MARDDETSSPVCPNCGWHVLRYAGHRCRPIEGAAADRLSAAVDAPSTKLGYGDGRVTFTLADDDGSPAELLVPTELLVGLDVRGEHFSWRYLHCLGELTHDDAADLLRTLQAWGARCRDRARTPEAALVPDAPASASSTYCLVPTTSSEPCLSLPAVAGTARDPDRVCACGGRSFRIRSDGPYQAWLQCRSCGARQPSNPGSGPAASDRTTS